MWLNTRFQPALGLCVSAVWLLAACQAPAPSVPVTLVATAATATASPTAQPMASPVASATPVGARPPATTPAVATRTATPLAAATTLAAPSSTPSPTVAPTDTALAASQPAPSPTIRPTLALSPAGPSSTPANPAVPGLYSTTGGPAGYSSRILCERAGAPCAPVMPPGDVSFRLVLASAAAAPWTHFVNFGLSVEKDGANAAALFMFVDAGWLQPGAVVGFGTSRNFSQSATYVIRSSGCLTLDRSSNNCQWATIAGDVVTFVIQ